MSGKALSRIVLCCAVVSFGLTAGCAKTKSVTHKKNVDQLYEEGLSSFFKGRYEEAEGKFTAVIFEFPFSEKSTMAEVRLAELYYYQGKYAEASAYLEDFIKRHPSHKDAPYAYYLLGMCYFNQKPKAERDQTSARNASSAFGELLSRYPGSIWADMARGHFDTCIESLAKSEMLVGDFYFKRKNFQGASERYGWLVQKYPSSRYAPKALFGLAKCYEASNNPQKAESTLEHLVSTYPESEYADDAKGLLASLSEREAKERASKPKQEEPSAKQSGALVPKEKAADGQEEEKKEAPFQAEADRAYEQEQSTSSPPAETDLSAQDEPQGVDNSEEDAEGLNQAPAAQEPQGAIPAEGSEGL
jgi:outer membrane protein assembly factor BamD